MTLQSLASSSLHLLILASGLHTIEGGSLQGGVSVLGELIHSTLSWLLTGSTRTLDCPYTIEKYTAKRDALQEAAEVFKREVCRREAPAIARKLPRFLMIYRRGRS